MTDDFRTRLEKEVAALDAPPTGDLVRNSLKEGRRRRSIRRWYQAGAVTASTLAVVAAVMGVQVVSGPTPGRSEAAAVVPVPSPTEEREKATPEGVLAALLETLPAGQTGHYAGRAGTGGEEDPLTVQTYLDNGQGPGMIRLSVWAQDPPEWGPGAESNKATLQPDGDRVTVKRLPGNCIQSLVVWVERSDGVVAQVNVASCLAWNGQRNPEGRMALTQQQAIELADDDRLGMQVPKRLADEGARRFPDLPGIG